MNQKKRRQGYSDEGMRDAIEDVKTNKMSIRGSAKLHNIPESTLRGRLNDPIDTDIRLGGPTIFTLNQEDQLAKHCIYMADRGYGYARWQILEIAANMAKDKGLKFSPTKHWFYGFLKRNPDVKIVNHKKRENMGCCIAPEIVTKYFSELKMILERYNIFNRPANIWNIYESGISLDHTLPKELSRCGHHPLGVTSGRSSTTTLVAAVSALGQTLPPYIIYKGQRLRKELISNEIEGSKFNTSPNGWVTSKIFTDFLLNHYLMHVTERPLVLLYDGHATYITIDIIDLARKSDVHLFILPPHSSHLIQPLDVSIISPLKESMNCEIHKYLHEHPNNVITKQLLPSLISTAYKSSMTSQNIMSFFCKTGICPFNPDIVKTQASTSQISVTVNLTNQTRKEELDSPLISVLFQDKVSTLNQSKKEMEVPPKKKRKKCVPPFGAAVVEQTSPDILPETA